jgi:hypothetical protein
MLRKVAVALAAIAACGITVSAQAGGHPKLTLSPSSYKVLFGHKLTLLGTVSGGSAGQRVSIEAWAYGASAPTMIGAVRAGPDGHFSVRVKPRIQTKYLVRTASATSNAVTVGVMPAVSVRELGNGKIWTRVRASRSFNRRFVKLQALVSGHWATVDRKRLSGASIAVFGAVPPTGPVRIAMSVNQLGAGYLMTSSHALGYKAYALTIAANPRVLYGHSLTLSGRLLNGRAGQRVSIVAWPYGRSAPLEIGSVRTDARGGWRGRVFPKVQTTYFARWASTSTSRVIVGVAPMVSVREKGNGGVWVRVKANRSFVGRMVKLQRRLVNGAWFTVAQRPLDVRSETVFPTPLPSSPMRVAMSVNQAGAGLLGTASHELAYHAV